MTTTACEIFLDKIERRLTRSAAALTLDVYGHADYWLGLAEMVREDECSAGTPASLGKRLCKMIREYGAKLPCGCNKRDPDDHERPEIERFKRSLDLADYAKRAGYQVRPEDGAPGLPVLDHPNRDRSSSADTQRPVDLRVGARLHAPGAKRARGAGACATPRLDRSLPGQGNHRRVLAAARYFGTPRGGGARSGTRSLARLSSDRSAPRLRRCAPSTVPGRPRAGPRTGKRAVAFGWIGRIKPRAQSPSLRLDASRRGRTARTEVERRLRQWREAQTATRS